MKHIITSFFILSVALVQGLNLPKIRMDSVEDGKYGIVYSKINIVILFMCNIGNVFKMLTQSIQPHFRSWL